MFKTVQYIATKLIERINKVQTALPTKYATSMTLSLVMIMVLTIEKRGIIFQGEVRAVSA